LAISVLRDLNHERVAEVQKVVNKIDRIQERISRTLMDADFERWQQYIRPDHEEWAASVSQLRKHGEAELANEIGSLLMTLRVIVHAERRL
jgi:GTP-binding protein EngB required for normal cell division